MTTSPTCPDDFGSLSFDHVRAERVSVVAR